MDKVAEALRLRASARSPHQQRVDSFMSLANQRLPLRPELMTPAERELRARLIFEEVMETINDLGVVILFAITGREEDLPLNNPFASGKKGDPRTFDHTYETVNYFDIVGVVDGCGDISVVTTGTLSALGVSDEAVLRAVDENNLDKFGPGHSFSPQGKLIKPPGHTPPDLGAILVMQGLDKKFLGLQMGD
jgi:predicted HAD superfamily Cof-like phosphohydrolase